MTDPTAVFIRTESIALDAFLKWAGLADTGGSAKQLVRSGTVLVNGRPELRPGHRLVEGDLVSLGAGAWRVAREAR